MIPIKINILVISLRPGVWPYNLGNCESDYIYMLHLIFWTEKENWSRTCKTETGWEKWYFQAFSKCYD